MTSPEEIRVQDRIRAIELKKQRIKAFLKRLDEVSKIYPSPGIDNQIALLSSELNKLGDKNPFL